MRGENWAGEGGTLKWDVEQYVGTHLTILPAPTLISPHGVPPPEKDKGSATGKGGCLEVASLAFGRSFSRCPSPASSWVAGWGR